MPVTQLWIAENRTTLSSVFCVPPRQVCILHAVDFEKYAYRASADEFLVPQVACVRRILYGFDAAAFTSAKDNQSCNFTFDVTGAKADLISDHVVTTCNGPWQLSMCRNLAIIGVPGNYRLELNDATAVGVANVYAELVNIDAIPLQVKDLFFI